jgi:hypothetical protein
MLSNKRVMADAISPLEDAGILLHVLSILGPGQHLFISAVSRAWRGSYQRLATVQMAELTYDYDDQAALHPISSQTTAYSTVFASASRVHLAHECGLAFDNESFQRLAGRCADLVTLRAAYELGLQLTYCVLLGAAEAGSVAKLHWLHIEQGCWLLESICNYAARGGGIQSLRWLQEHGSALTASTCEGAAAGAHLHVLHFLRGEGCEWDDILAPRQQLRADI